MKTIILLLNLALLNHCAAETVRFDDADRGPADSLNLGGITITGNGQPVATATGYGLGVSGVGPIYEVNTELRYQPPAGAGVHADGPTERVIFNVPAGYYITSLSLQPHYNIFNGTGELSPDQFYFNIQITAGGGFYEHTVFPPIGSLITVPLPELPPDLVLVPPMVFIGSGYGDLGGGYPYNLMFWRSDHLHEEQIFQWGFSILSMEYAAVPEPSTLALLSVGGLAWLVGRRIKP